MTTFDQKLNLLSLSTEKPNNISNDVLKASKIDYNADIELLTNNPNFFIRIDTNKVSKDDLIRLLFIIFDLKDQKLIINHLSNFFSYRGIRVDSHKLVEKLLDFFEKLKTNRDDDLVDLMTSIIKRDEFKRSANTLFLTGINTLYDEELRLMLVGEASRLGWVFDPHTIDKKLFGNITNRDLFYDFKLMKPFYDGTIAKESLIAELLSNSKFPTGKLEHFYDEEYRYLRENKIDMLLAKYKQFKIVDDETLGNIYQIAIKYNKNLTYDHFLVRLSNCPNMMEVVADIASNYGLHRYETSNIDMYKELLLKFELIFAKTRFKDFIDKETFDVITFNNAKKFDYKIWNEFASLPVFNKDSNSKTDLIHFISVMGLFEVDDKKEERRRRVYSLFSHQNYELREEQFELINDVDFVANSFVKCKLPIYKARPGGFYDTGVLQYLDAEMSLDMMKRLKKQDGNLGKQITDFITPYAKTIDGYRLKEGVEIPDLISDTLGDYLTDEQYNFIVAMDFDKKDDDDYTPMEDIACFVSPFILSEIDGYKLKSDLSKEDYEKVEQKILGSVISGLYTYDAMHEMFSDCKQKFDENFYDFIIDNYDQIICDDERGGTLAYIQSVYDIMTAYYLNRGHKYVCYDDAINFIYTRPYDVKPGDEEFADEAHCTNVTLEGYLYYSNLLEIMNQRLYRTIPNHVGNYTYVDKDGKEYKLITKIFQSKSYMNLLIGESKFTNCCQRYNGVGQSCMEHAATSPNGGILATFLVDETNENYDKQILLTQSWIWTNESKLCLDNVEATSVITSASYTMRTLYQNMVMFVLKQVAKDIAKTSKVEVNAYVEKEMKKIEENGSLIKKGTKRMKELKEIANRQVIKLVTVGSGMDDLRIASNFKKLDKSLNYGPKDYKGYTDADNGHEYVIYQSPGKILPIDPEYVCEPFYCDDRSVECNTYKFHSHRDLRIAYGLKFLKENPTLEYERKIPTDAFKEFAKLYNINYKEMKLLVDTDWYLVYTDDDNEIMVYDLIMGKSRFSKNVDDQRDSIIMAVCNLIKSAYVKDEQQNISKVKAIRKMHNEMEIFDTIADHLLTPKDDVFIPNDYAYELLIKKEEKRMTTKEKTKKL